MAIRNAYLQYYRGLVKDEIKRKHELTLIKQIHEHKLPIPLPEYQFHPDRKWRFDFAYPALKIGIEVEGGIWINGRHNRGSGYIRDCEKYNAAALAGWRILRFTPDMISNLTAIDSIENALK